MENDTDNDQGDKDFKDMEVKEEVLNHEIGQVEEELVIIPVQENLITSSQWISWLKQWSYLQYPETPTTTMTY